MLSFSISNFQYCLTNKQINCAYNTHRKNQITKMIKGELFKEALREANDMRTASKMTIEKNLLESLQPRISQLVSKNLQEISDEYDQEDEEMDETLDIASLMQEESDEETDETPEAEASEHADGEEAPEGDEGDVSVADMSKTDLEQIIKSVIQGILGDDQAGEVDSTEMDGGDELPAEDESEMDEDGMYEGLDDIVNEIMSEMGEDTKEDSLQEQIKTLKAENSDLKKANAVYKKTINESKLSLVQLSYINGLIVESKLSNEQIIKFTEILEKTKSVQEAKNVYDAINESVKTKAPKQAIKTQKIKESWGVASNQILPNKTKTQNEDPFIARLRRNAY